MFRTMIRFTLALLAALPVGLAAYENHYDTTPASPAAAAAVVQAGQQAALTNDDWCREAQRNNDDDDDETFCEVREFTLPRGAVRAETSNGSVRVTGESRGDVLVRAMVMARARSASDAQALAKEVTISTSGTIRATGPRTRNHTNWWVSFRVQAPAETDLDLDSSNGSLAVTGVKGTINLETSNGSIRLMDVGGNVDADTSNGSIQATLSGTTWDGAGLSMTTSNGSVRLELPETYNAHLMAGTSNGSLNIDFPVMVQGRLNRDIDTTLGSGGPTIRVKTSNGSVHLQRK
jgi:DUF4097 and DUF4098 domain-containing protein YvlB